MIWYATEIVANKNLLQYLQLKILSCKGRVAQPYPTEIQLTMFQ